MVKLNSKVTNKFKNPRLNNTTTKVEPSRGSSGNAVETEHQNFRLLLMKMLSKALFGLDDLSYRHSSKYAYIGMRDMPGILNASVGDINVAFENEMQAIKQGYDLFLDDERIPDGPEVPGIGKCIVTRTCKDAIEVVEQLGCPEYLHLDYCLQNGNVSTPFVDWFIEKYTPPNSGLNEYFGYHVHSMSEEGRRLLSKKLCNFERMIWDREKAKQVTTPIVTPLIKP